MHPLFRKADGLTETIIAAAIEVGRSILEAMNDDLRLTVEDDSERVLLQIAAGLKTLPPRDRAGDEMGGVEADLPGGAA